VVRGQMADGQRSNESFEERLHSVTASLRDWVKVLLFLVAYATVH
jgi:hypothetical protein